MHHQKVHDQAVQAERLLGTGALTLDFTRYDSIEVQGLTAEVQQHYVRLYGGPDDSPLAPDELAPPHGDFLLARLDGAAVAMGGWRRADDVSALGGHRAAELRRMFVAPPARRRGVARLLLGALERSAAAAGADVMVLSSGEPQQDALRFYRACGYADIPGFGYYARMPRVRCLARRI